MDKSPLVSVIVPAYNAERFIRQTLDSVLSQTYGNIEVLVVDDGSKDKTLPILESIAAKDDRVLLLQQSNQGVAAARNLAIEKSTGEYISPIDADDLWHPQKIEKQVAFMLRSGPSLGLVYTWWVSIDEEGLPIYTSPKWRMEGQVYKTLLALNFIGNASVPLIRRECIERAGVYNAQWREHGGQGCEDWDFSLRIAEHYQFGVIPEHLVGYRSAKGSMALNFTTMKMSHELMLQNVQKSHPEIPQKFFSWSRSNFYIYLAGVSFKNRQYRAAFDWLFKAFWSEEVTPFSPWSFKLVLISLPKIAANLLTSFTGKNHHAWHSFTQPQVQKRK
jgi:glycosyltransferase involved in cell wall biosynthesis